MKSHKTVYIPIGVPTFHLESARLEFDNSVNMLKSLTNDLIYPNDMLLTIDDLTNYLDSVDPDFIILQNTTFANSAYCSEVLKRFSCPMLLWTLREPVIDGGRLRLNSLTGAYSAANQIQQMGIKNFEYVYGSPLEKNVITTIQANLTASKLKKSLKSLNMAAIGSTPQGFGFGRALDSELLKHFGVNLESIEARELMNNAKKYNSEDYKDLLDESNLKMLGLDKLPEKNVDAYLRLYKSYMDYITSKNIGALASRCWPDFFTEYGTPVCAVLGMLNDNGIASSCESDLYGALSMHIGKELSDHPTYFGDPVSLNEKDNTITFWHCGTAACSLAREDEGPTMGVHPNRKLGPTMEFGCKPCEEVTIFRIGKDSEGKFRFFISTGEALDAPKQFCGTSVVIKTKTSAEDLVLKSVKDGWEPHFVVIYKNVAKELKILGRMLEIDIFEY